MQKEKKDWLNQAVGKKAERAKQVQINLKKDEIRQSAAMAMAMAKVQHQLRNDMNLKASNGRKEQALVSPLRDQTLEFDIDDQQDGYTLLSDEDVGKHLHAARVVSQLSEVFQAKGMVPKVDEDGNVIKALTDVEKEFEEEVDGEGDQLGQKVKKKVTRTVQEMLPVMEEQDLFDMEKELGPEFYQPLVRQGLIGETFVPNDFSETQEMITETFDAYAERLKDSYEPSSVKRFFKENKSLMLTTATSGIALASQGIKADGIAKFDMADALDANSLTWGKELAKGGADQGMEVAAFGWDVVSGKLLDAKEEYDGRKEGRKEKKDERKKSRRTDELKRMAELAADSMASALGEALEPWQLHMTAPAVFTAALNRSQIAVALAGKQPKNDNEEPQKPTAAEVARAVAACTTAFAKVFTDCDPGVPGSAAAMAAAGNTMKGSFEGAFDTDGVIDAMEPYEEDFGAVLKAFADAAKVAIAAAVSDQVFKTLLDGQKEAIAGKASKIMVADFMEQTRRGEEEERNEASEEFARMQNAKDDKERASLIDKKIARLKRDQALLKWSTGLVGMGFDVASKFLGPMAIAGSAMKLAVGIGKAVARTRDFLNFVESQGDMFRAASPYSAPLDNFISNAEIQAMHYEINAALELVIMIGAIVETAGLASGMGAAAGVVAGKTLQAVGAGGQAIEAVLYEIKKRYGLEQAWTLYKTALLRPANRKLALQAMQGNPTLAKYAVAWGAVIKKDVLVADFMGNCGLDSTTLKDPRSSLDKVQKYLEARMPDDNVIDGRRPVSQDWEPDSISLSNASWASVVRRAKKSAELEDLDSTAIEDALLRYEEDLAALTRAHEEGTRNPAKKPTAKAVQDAKANLVVLQKALGSYKPQRKDGGGTLIRHEQMLGVVGKFIALVPGARLGFETLGA